MNVLVYGSGAREHAICLKISKSKLLSKLYLACPNDGFKYLGEEIKHNSYEELAIKVKQKNIELVIIGPEQPLMDGLTDMFINKGIKVIGATSIWARLEGSKSFAKDFMVKHNIKTAEYIIIKSKEEAYTAIDIIGMPIVIKADGLCAGKGVKIAYSKSEALENIDAYLKGKFGGASEKIILEKFLEGEELSLISLWDGQTLLPFIPARDYKKLSNETTAPNTGGMGAYCPVLIDDNFLNQYCDNLQMALLAEKADFCGVIYSGLINTENGLMVLEYNMRFGDPETQVLLMHLDSDLLDIFIKMTKNELNKITLKWKLGISACVTVAAKGYPFNPIKGGFIENLDEICKKYDITPFSAGVKKDDGQIFANGGRVLSLCKTSLSPFEDIFSACDELNYKDKLYRKDIGS